MRQDYQNAAQAASDSAILNRVLSRVRGLRKTSRGWMALCPAHTDRSPSLSIKDAGDRILFHCFAGCSYREICDALGIGPLETEREFMATSRGRKIARLSRMSHRIEASLLVSELNISMQTAEQIVMQRIRRERSGIKPRSGESVGMLEYLRDSCGLEPQLAGELVRRASRG